MPAPAQKKPLKPKAPTAPKGPSAKSKTGNSACSAAASNWQLAIRGKASINPDTYQTLAKCRAMTRTSKNAEGRARAGYNLSDQGANAIKGRLQSRFDRDLITKKSRDARVKELVSQRKEKQAAAVAAKPAKPFDAIEEGYKRRGISPSDKYDRDKLAYFKKKLPKAVGLALVVEKRNSSRTSLHTLEKDRITGSIAEGRIILQSDFGKRKGLTEGYKSSIHRGIIGSADKLRAINKAEKQKAAPFTKPAPAPAKFSLGGQLAPGRGTKERTDLAGSKQLYRKELRAILKPVKKKRDASQQITKASISSTTSKGSDFLTPVTEQRYQMASVRDTVTKIKAKDRARAESQSGVQTLKTSQLTADPNQFQYKMNTAGPVGVTDQFKETRVWNKELAGVVQVWKSPTENKTFVVNGHHRYELAQRLGVGKLNVQYIQAQNAAEARIKGALTNIAEGRGTSVDAAKFFRDQPKIEDWSKELKNKGISLSERTASEGLALKDVHPKIWRDVVNEMTPLSRAVSIGKSGLKQEDQLNIYNRSTAGNWTSGKTSEFATELKNSARTKVKSGSLFGDDEEVSVFEHRAALSDRLKTRLSSDKNLFSKVARGRNASRIESVGSNKIDKESSATRATEADSALMTFDRERKYSGRVNNELNNFGQRVAKGEKIDKVYNEFEKRMTQTLRLMNSGKFDRRAARLKAIAK